MDDMMHRFSLASRLGHLLMTLAPVGLYLTGLRLAWFGGGGSSPLFAPQSWLDVLAPTGQVYRWHKTCGLVLIAGAILYLVELMLTGQLGRLTALFTDRRRDYRKKLFYIAVLGTTAVSIVSGITLYTGLYEGAAGHMFMNRLHHYAAVFLVILTIAHLIDVLFGGGVRVNAIFFGYRDGTFFSVRPFVMAMVGAMVLAGAVGLLIDRPSELVCRRLGKTVNIDGLVESIVWNRADSLQLTLAHGANLDGGVSEVTLKSFHDGRNVYFLLSWDDPDRSFNRRLVKMETEWMVGVSEYPDLFGERIYYEDQAVLSIHRNTGGCAVTCHLRTPSKMGLHYTIGDTVDVWQWRAVSTNPIRRADDGWWAGFRDDSIGGRHLDNLAAGGYFSNLNRDWRQPYFLPAHRSVYGWIDPYTPFVTPYFVAEDTFCLGAQAPGVIVTPFQGDRGDVRAEGRWLDGRWTVEFARALKTGSSADTEMRGELYLGVAIFDNASSKHAFHLRPIRLVVE